MVARRAGVPVVAAGIAGTYEVLPRQRKIPRLRGTFVVSYSEPFHLDHSAGEESNLDRIRREILGQMARARELWRS
jgi:1-acyl-sn-glycerol-3-phosphate acyltransferase